jgi:hypothetical protein
MVRRLGSIQGDADRFVVELQAAIVLAGGSKIEEEKLSQMTLQSLMGLIYPNGIRLAVIPAPYRFHEED